MFQNVKKLLSLTFACIFVFFPWARYSANQFWCLWHIFRQTIFGVIFSPGSWIFLWPFYRYSDCASSLRDASRHKLEHRSSYNSCFCHMEQDCSWSGGREGGGRSVNNVRVFEWRTDIFWRSVYVIIMIYRERSTAMKDHNFSCLPSCPL